MSLDFSVIFPGVLDANGFVMLSPRFQHFHALIGLPRHHGDPFDRLIIAQARVDGLTIITSDPHFPAYDIPILW